MGSFTRAAGGLGAAVLISAGLTVTPAMAQAKKQISVPCSTPSLIAAINTLNSLGAGTLDLASNCTYNLTSVAATGTRGPDGLPIITGNITLSGGPSTTIQRAPGSTPFRIIEVATGGILSVQGIFII